MSILMAVAWAHASPILEKKIITTILTAVKKKNNQHTRPAARAG
jgi:hypothetical protein